MSADITRDVAGNMKAVSYFGVRRLVAAFDLSTPATNAMEEKRRQVAALQTKTPPDAKRRQKGRNRMMKRVVYGISVVALVFVSVSITQAQELSKADRDRALQYLESTKKNIEDATRGLTDAQWNFKPSPFKWSIAQVMEHIAASEDLLRGLAEQTLKGAPPDRDLTETDKKVLTMVPDRSNKVEAPKPLRPTNRFASPAAALSHFLESRAKTIELLKNTPDLRAHSVNSAFFGKIDAYQSILFVAAHSERHTKQLNEVKADPKFPK
jgi:DinB family protein